VDTLKIDRAFISHMDSDPESREIVRVIVMLAHNLGLKVVAEGTETETHIDLLKHLNCEMAQGYFFSRPADDQAMLKLLASNQSARAATAVSEERQIGQPINHFNLKCTMTEGSVDTIVSAIYLMMAGPGTNAGLDFAEVVRQLLCDLTISEQRQFWTELQALCPQKWPRGLATINSSDITSLTEQLDGKAAKAGSLK
jgi:hypothetical protein